MTVTDFGLYVAAIVCLLLAALQPVLKLPAIRWEFIAGALIVCSLL